jgi:hypothetical protein
MDGAQLALQVVGENAGARGDLVVLLTHERSGKGSSGAGGTTMSWLTNAER